MIFTFLFFQIKTTYVYLDVQDYHENHVPGNINYERTLQPTYHTYDFTTSRQGGVKDATEYDFYQKPKFHKADLSVNPRVNPMSFEVVNWDSLDAQVEAMLEFLQYLGKKLSSGSDDERRNVDFRNIVPLQSQENNVNNAQDTQNVINEVRNLSINEDESNDENNLESNDEDLDTDENNNNVEDEQDNDGDSVNDENYEVSDESEDVGLDTSETAPSEELGEDLTRENRDESQSDVEGESADYEASEENDALSEEFEDQSSTEDQDLTESEEVKTRSL